VSRKYRPDGRYQVASHVAAVLLVLIIFVTVSYFFFLAKPDEQARRLELEAEYEAAAARWANGRPSSFRYVLDRRCDCPPEDEQAYIVTDRDGHRGAEFPIPVESVAGDLITTPPRPLWIHDIFGIIERAIGSGAVIDVRYDRALGYPETVVIGPDEVYEIRDFEIVSP